MKPRARIERSDDGVIITAPYSRIFVEMIKDDIPSFARRYDPAVRTWRVDSLYADEAIAIARTCFDIVVNDRRNIQQTSTTGTGWAALMFTALPDRLREPVFKALVRILHPDAGGDTDATQQLTQAYDKSRGVR